MVKTLASYWRFLLAGLFNHVQTGAIIPSQRFLISRMIAPVPPGYRGLILELGPGTGALTLRLAARCPSARILACEINPVLAEDLKRSIAISRLGSRVEVISDSAQHLLATMARRGEEQVAYIISGIPLGTLAADQTVALIDGIAAGLREGGMYIQFQYSLLDRKRIRARFHQVRTVPALLNFPPAVVYYAQR
jgi:phosphatidylethanolamine/phosphatidyl-N-methylethanolamine N-methyltransferase